MATPCLSGAITAPIAVSTNPAAPMSSALLPNFPEDESAGITVEAVGAWVLIGGREFVWRSHQRHPPPCQIARAEEHEHTAQLPIAPQAAIYPRKVTSCFC